ncbi:MAG TPA: DUF3256 family protein [Paludibacter sp.]|nr:DUF3256 family protein [Paludibacter sp.]
MKRKNNLYLVLLLLLALTAQVFAVRNIEYYYVGMPDRLNPTLTRQNRLELIEYAKASQGDTVANRFGKQARLLYVDTVQQCIQVQNTPVSVFEMKLFATSAHDTIIGVIHTVCTPVCSSDIQFYSVAWTSLPIRFPMPRATQWLDRKKLPESGIDPAWVENVLSTGFVSLTFNRNGDTIFAKNNTLDFLSDTDRKDVEPFLLNNPVAFRLVGKEWVEVK